MFQNHAMSKAATEKWVTCPPSVLVPHSGERVDKTKCIACSAIAHRMGWLTLTSSFLPDIQMNCLKKHVVSKADTEKWAICPPLLLVQTVYCNCALNGTVETQLQRINISVSKNT